MLYKCLFVSDLMHESETWGVEREKFLGLQTTETNKLRGLLKIKRYDTIITDYGVVGVRRGGRWVNELRKGFYGGLGERRW